MGYDAIRDVHVPSDPPTPSPTTSTSRRGIAMLLNEDPLPPSPSTSKKSLRYDPIHNPDMPSPMDQARPSSSSSTASGYFQSREAVSVSPAFPPQSLQLPGPVNQHQNNSLASHPSPSHFNSTIPPQSHRSATSSPTFATRPSSGSVASNSLSPHTSPMQRTPSLNSRSMPPPISIPYNPRPRISPQTAVLQPITQGEIEHLKRSHRNPLRKSLKNGHSQSTNVHHADGAQEEPSTSTAMYSPSRPSDFPELDDLAPPQSQNNHQNFRRAEHPSDLPHSSVHANQHHSLPQSSMLLQAQLPRGTKRGSDAQEDFEADHGRMLHPSQRTNADLVAHHYNARPEVGKAAREESPIIGLRSFNNWIKAVLIAKFARPAIMATNDRPEGLEYVGSKRRPKKTARVLDLGCGKGGDLSKWVKADIASYIGVDIASKSIEQARGRYNEQKRKAFNAEFYDFDCYSYSLAERLPPSSLNPEFDVVTMQFCMHYAFETEAKARMMLHNVTTHLRVGGAFIGTVPNSKLIRRRLKKVGKGEQVSFGNSVYKVSFESRDWIDKDKSPDFNPYGVKYSFWLQDAVDVPEYVVFWDEFVKLAESYGLRLDYREEFHKIYDTEKSHKDYQFLLKTMRVVDQDGESALDEAQWEAANFYVGFAFTKTSNPTS